MKNRPVRTILYLAQKHVYVQIMLMFEPYTILQGVNVFPVIDFNR